MLKEVTLPGIAENVESGEVISSPGFGGGRGGKGPADCRAGDREGGVRGPCPRTGQDRGNRREGGTDRQGRRSARQAPDGWRAYRGAQTSGEGSQRAAGDRGGREEPATPPPPERWSRVVQPSRRRLERTTRERRCQDGRAGRSLCPPFRWPRHPRSGNWHASLASTLPRSRAAVPAVGSRRRMSSNMRVGSSAADLFLHGLLGGCPWGKRSGRCRILPNGAPSSGSP